jgi:hypothetical protein
MQKYSLTPISVALISVFLAACGGGGSSSSTSSTSSGGSGGSAATALSTPDQVDVVSASQDTTAALSSNLRAALRARAFNSVGTDYTTDEQNLHVWHPALEPVESVNSILCFIGQLQADDMLNQGDYIALIDDASCDKGGGDESGSGNQSAGADQVPSFVESIANVSRADGNSPMIINMWVPEMEMGGGGETKTIKARIEVTEAPSANKPFGEFRMSFGMFTDDGATASGGGELATSTSSNGQLGLTLYESSPENFGGNDVVFTQRASILTNAAQTAGVAVTQSSITGDVPEEMLEEGNFGYALAYDSDHVLVNKADTFANLTADPSEESCLSRNDFHEAVWRYNLYNADTGARITLNSGFPFRYESSEGTARGHVGYWGVWTDGDNLTNGQTITKENFGDDNATPETYTVVTAPGRLIKNTVTSLPVTELDGIQFNFYDEALGATDYDQWVVEYLEDSSPAGFYKMAGMTYGGNNTPSQQTEITPVLITLSEFQPYLSMWSQQLGGSVNWQEGAENITYFAEEFVDGDETGINELFAGGDTATLYCYDSCPKGTLELSDLSGFSGPYDSPISLAMGGEVTPIQYTFSRDGDNAFTLVRTTGGEEAVVLASGITSDQLRSTFYSWGVRSGNMVTAALDDPLDIYNLAEGESSYRWETGLDSWNQMTIVKQGDTTVTFDKPLEFSYQHTADNDRSSNSTIAARFAGQRFQLNYGGPGQLWGIPSRAVGAEGDAIEGQHFRYYPSFNLADGVLLGSSNQYVVKAVDVEQKMVRDPGACSDLSFDGLIEPPSALSSLYNVNIGAVPTVDDAPAVIGGIVQ